MFFYLYGNAVFDLNGVIYGTVIVGRGQILKSYRKLIEDLEYIENNAIKRPSISSIKRTLDELVSEGRITILGTGLGTLITIVNYEEYQRLDNYKKNGAWNATKNTVGTPLEHRWNNNKNVKNVKNDSLTPHKEILEIYHSICTSLPKVKALTDKRKGHLNARWDEYDSIESFTELFTRAEKSDFLSGRKPNERSWKCDFDWLINQQNMSKVLEGKYDNKGPSSDDTPKKTVIR